MPNLPTANGGENKAPMGNHSNSKRKTYYAYCHFQIKKPIDSKLFVQKPRYFIQSFEMVNYNLLIKIDYKSMNMRNKLNLNF